MGTIDARARRIEPEHIRLALVAAKARTAGMDVPRFAAYSNGHDAFGCGCPRRPYSDELKRKLITPPLFYGLQTVPRSLVERVRTLGGPGEVKRTWGCGYRALVAEMTERGAA